MTHLCKFCAKAHDLKPYSGKCFICEGILEKLETMQKEAIGILKKQEIKQFSISTLIPKQILVNEEKILDKKLGGSSLKSFLNQEISRELSKKTGAEYDKDGEIRIVFDLRSGKILTEKIPVFMFGRYKKLIAGLSQSRWLCTDCKGRGCSKCNNKGKYYDSVEEEIGEVLRKGFSAGSYTMHASGREDVDATNTAGRSFVFEIKGVKTKEINLDKIMKEINDAGKVAVENLRIVKRTFVEVVTESHFDKEYEADVEFEAVINNAQIKQILSIQGKILEQRTPSRVAHRRADLVRKRKIIELELLKKKDTKHMKFRIKAEAGTYIKELISGDSGRTSPSFNSVLGFNAKCIALNVSKIDDELLDLIEN